MGDFEGVAPTPVAGYCEVCGAYIGPTARLCKRHMHLLVKARRQTRELVAYARRKRGRELCKEWWEATDGA